jgi:hypothetical protein
MGKSWQRFARTVCAHPVKSFKNVAGEESSRRLDIAWEGTLPPTGVAGRGAAAQQAATGQQGLNTRPGMAGASPWGGNQPGHTGQRRSVRGWG